jgi:Tol biopolymer transport system component
MALSGLMANCGSDARRKDSEEPVDSGNLIEIVFKDGTSVHEPRFSPDGATIAFVQSTQKADSSELAVMASAGEQRKTLALAGTYLASVDWFSDGKRLAITSDKGIEIVTLGSSPERALVQDEFAATSLDVSADGKTILYSVNGSTNIFVLSGF